MGEARSNTIQIYFLILNEQEVHPDFKLMIEIKYIINTLIKEWRNQWIIL